MALSGYQPRFVHQPSGLSRINAKHWLADSLLFAHSGLQGFVWHEPTTSILRALRRPTERGQINGLAVYGNNSAYEEYEAACENPNVVTLSAWSIVDSTLSTTASGIIALGSSAGARSSMSLYVTASSVDPNLRASNTNGGTSLAATGSAGQLQHLVGVASSSADRKIYINAALSGTNTTTRAIDVTNRIIVAADRGGTSGSIGAIARTQGSFAALQLVLNRALSADEVERLYREQLSEPWALFEPQRIFIPVAAAGGALPTLSLPTYMPGSLSSVGFRPRVTAS